MKTQFVVMPDRRKHRGPHPEDAGLFGEAQVDRLQRAVSDLSWLLSGGYAIRAALKLVGDRFQLRERQRLAVMRCACSDEAKARRAAIEQTMATTAGQAIVIDGLNVLTTVEAALAGGVVLVGRDSCYRDMASVHGTYRQVAETETAVRLVGKTLNAARIAEAEWLLDKPVSNSGRLKRLIESLAEEEKWDWRARLVPNPDRELATSDRLVATADSEILGQCRSWVPLARWVVQANVPNPWLLDLRGIPSGGKAS